MLIFGIDPGISGAISIFKNNKFVEVLDMPTMIDGKKNKRQVNGAQFAHIIKEYSNIPYPDIFISRAALSNRQ